MLVWNCLTVWVLLCGCLASAWMTHGATIPSSALQLGMFMYAVQNNIRKATEVITPHVFKQFVNCVLIWLKVLMPDLVWFAKRAIRLMMTLLQQAGTSRQCQN